MSTHNICFFFFFVVFLWRTVENCPIIITKYSSLTILCETGCGSNNRKVDSYQCVNLRSRELPSLYTQYTLYLSTGPPQLRYMYTKDIRPDLINSLNTRHGVVCSYQTKYILCNTQHYENTPI